MKHLLSLKDLTQEEILDIIDLAIKLKKDNKEGRTHHYLKGKILGMIFQSLLQEQGFPLRLECISSVGMLCF